MQDFKFKDKEAIYSIKLLAYMKILVKKCHDNTWSRKLLNIKIHQLTVLISLLKYCKIYIKMLISVLESDKTNDVGEI
jgi:hypothetical protein